jgi:hypothetical protein
MFFDLLLILGTYGAFFKAVHYVQLHQRDALKLAFDVELRNFDSRTQRRFTHIIASACTCALLCVSPLLKLLVYMVAFLTVDVTQLNFLLLLLCVTRILSLPTLDWRDRTLQGLLLQGAHVALNYYNPRTLIFSLYYLVDALFQYDDIIDACKFILDHVVTSSENELCWEIIRHSIVYRKQVRIAHLITLAGIIVLSVLWSRVLSKLEILFYYYGVYRLSELVL